MFVADWLFYCFPYCSTGILLSTMDAKIVDIRYHHYFSVFCFRSLSSLLGATEKFIIMDTRISERSHIRTNLMPFAHVFVYVLLYNVDVLLPDWFNRVLDCMLCILHLLFMETSCDKRSSFVGKQKKLSFCDIIRSGAGPGLETVFNVRSQRCWIRYPRCSRSKYTFRSECIREY